MDTSETYIKMCDCKEIQAIVKPVNTIANAFRNGDWASVGGTEPYCLNDIPLANSMNRADIIWLPRQDQLQEMVVKGRTPTKAIMDLEDAFHDYFCWDDGWIPSQYACSFTSMEQLWLAFVMKEKYNKMWNGEEWIKAS